MKLLIILLMLYIKNKPFVGDDNAHVISLCNKNVPFTTLIESFAVLRTNTFAIIIDS